MLKQFGHRIILFRGFKNFGHKRQPESTFTMLWHGFLTFTFIGIGIEWKRISSYLFGESESRSVTSPLEDSRTTDKNVQVRKLPRGRRRREEEFRDRN